MSGATLAGRFRAVRSDTVAGLLAAAVMLGLGLVRISRSFGYDEGYTYTFFIAGGSVRRALTTQLVFNNHPMFSATQAAAWRAGFTGETSQRLGPLLCAAITVGVAVWLVARRAGLIGAAMAGVVLVFNPLFFDHARQLRGYALATMAVLLALVAIRQSWVDPRRRWLVVQGSMMVIAVTTHAYSAVTIVMAAVAALVLGRVERRHLVAWAVSACTALAIMAPVLDDARANSAARGTQYTDWFLETLIRSLTGGERVAVVLTIAAATIGAVDVGRRSRRHAAALAAAFGVLVVVVIVVWQVLRPFDLYPRFFISLTPLVAILAGLGVSRIPRMGGAVVVVVLAAVLVPPAVELWDRESGIRDAAIAADAARARELGVCGIDTEPMWAYTAPLPSISALNGFGGCDVFISVLGLGPEQRVNAAERYSDRIDLGGGTELWADVEVLDQIIER